MSKPSPVLREQSTQDALQLAYWLTDPQAEWKQWDAPYYHAANAQKDGAQSDHLPSNERMIAVEGQAIGMVTRHPEQPQAGGWWELGILIYDPQFWGGGTGTQALRDWTGLTFAETGAHVLTLSTWSGNERMIRAGLRVGYRECARVREARLWKGVRYDSVRLDLLRREWEQRPA